jgi:hypothetical protein
LEGDALNHGAILAVFPKSIDEATSLKEIARDMVSLLILGLIFLKYADFKFRQAEQELKEMAAIADPQASCTIRLRVFLICPRGPASPT